MSYSHVAHWQLIKCPLSVTKPRVIEDRFGSKFAVGYKKTTCLNSERYSPQNQFRRLKPQPDAQAHCQRNKLTVVSRAITFAHQREHVVRIHFVLPPTQQRLRPLREVSGQIQVGQDVGVRHDHGRSSPRNCAMSSALNTMPASACRICRARARRSSTDIFCGSSMDSRHTMTSLFKLRRWACFSIIRSCLPL